MAESAKKPRHVSPATHSTARPVSRFLNAHTLEPRVRPRRSRVCGRAGAARAAFPPRAARRHRHPVTRVQQPHTPRGEAQGEDCLALGDSNCVSLRALARGLAPSRGHWASVAREAPPGAAAVALSGSRVLAMGPTWRLLVFLSFLHVAWFDLPTFRQHFAEEFAGATVRGTGPHPSRPVCWRGQGHAGLTTRAETGAVQCSARDHGEPGLFLSCRLSSDTVRVWKFRFERLLTMSPVAPVDKGKVTRSFSMGRC